jgi:uncharacterized protein YndB with AHSA1/START domain
VTGAGATLAIELEQLVAAPREDVFRAFVEPAELRRWWGPRGFTVPEASLDAWAGGRYRIAMRPPGGEPFHLTGEYREVAAPERLVCTFAWEPPHPDDRETVVTVVLEDRGDATRVTVRQGAFATEERRELHRQGWRETLDRLREHLAGDPPG